MISEKRSKMKQEGNHIESRISGSRQSIESYNLYNTCKVELLRLGFPGEGTLFPASAVPNHERCDATYEEQSNTCMKKETG